MERAVLHLEGAADSVDLSEDLSQHAERLRAGELTPQQFSDILFHGQEICAIRARRYSSSMPSAGIS
jgi:hypothetical protein